jgi:hypothetical protein
MSSPVQISSRWATCQIVALAAVMAITKWSIFSCQKRLVAIVAAELS